MHVVLAGAAMLAGCTDASDHATIASPAQSTASTTRTTPSPSTASTNSSIDVLPPDREYERAWLERFTTDDLDGLPFHGIEDCAATAALAAIDSTRLSTAGVSPNGVAAGNGLEPVEVSAADIARFASGLRQCDLALGYSWQIRQIMPAFISDSDAACVGASLGDDGEYADRLASWILAPDSESWDDAIVASFHRAMSACPHAYATITISGLERDNGPLPEAGVACLTEQLGAEVDELLSGDRQRSDAALRRALEPCFDVLGDYGATLREEFD
ncbi:MAG TPA: hypothetical protein VFV63_03355 [Ilumatobacteraceae bacterium]|nr:hypothetical protein [Ilumatobacteraceae bacterium]